MLNNIKMATKDTFIYSLGNISTKIIGLVLLPLYTSKLSLSEYGILGTIEITTQLMIAAFSFSLYQALNRWYWDKKYKYKQKSIFFTVLVSLLIASFTMFILFVPFAKKFAVILLGSKEYTALFILLITSACLQVITQLLLSLMRLQRKPLRFSITNIIKLVFTMSLTIYFIVIKGKGIEGILQAQVLGFILFITINAKFILKNIIPVFERSILKEMIQFSYPLAISSISSVLLVVTDRYAVRYIVGLEGMGLYSLSFKIANILKLFIINSLSSALMPLKLQMMDKEGNRRFYAKIMTYTAYGFIILLLFLSLFSKEFIKVVAQDPGYYNAYQIVPLLCFTQLFELLRKNANFGLIIKKKTKIISSLTILISTVNIGLNIILVNYFGVLGGAIAALITQFAFFSFIFKYAQRYYPVPYEIKRIILMALTSMLIIITSFVFVNTMSIVPRLVIKLLSIFSFPVILYFFNFYEKIEIERLKGAWQKWRDPRNWKKNFSKIKIK